MNSAKTAKYWKDRYQMLPHPEGGWYNEFYRANFKCKVPWSDIRNASTAIVYMLENRDKSAFHKIKSDELWHYYDGNTSILIHCIDESGNYTCLKLGYVEEALPCQVVPAGSWFAAELADTRESFVLAGCTVSPGFDFMDFTMANHHELSKEFPQHSDLIAHFTTDNK